MASAFLPCLVRASTRRPAASCNAVPEVADLSSPSYSRASANFGCLRVQILLTCLGLPAARRYNDELARKRGEGEHEKQRARNRELVALQEEGARRQEAERRRVAEQIEAERRATEKYKVLQHRVGYGYRARHAWRGLLPQAKCV